MSDTDAGDGQDRSTLDIAVWDFLHTIFAFDELEDDEVANYAIARAFTKEDGTPSLTLPSFPMADKRKLNIKRKATHFSPATYAKNEVTTDRHGVDRLPRRTAFVKMIVATIFDDIGKKVDACDLPRSWELETSPGNFQHGFLMEPTDDIELFGKFIYTCGQIGLTDKGACKVNQLFRVPGSQPEGKEHPAKLTHWNPDLIYTLEDLIDGLIPGGSGGLMARPTGQGKGDIDPLADDVIVDDAFTRWVRSQDWYLGDIHRGGWEDIICPWHEAHTGGDTKGTSYLPPTREDPLRAFSCLHDHCDGRNAKDFLKWCVEQGAPDPGGLKYEPKRDVTELAAFLTPGLVWKKPAKKRPVHKATRLHLVVEVDDSGPVQAEDPRIDDDDAEAEEIDVSGIIMELQDRLVLYAPKNQIIDLLGSAQMPMHSYTGAANKFAMHDIVSQRGVERVVDIWVRLHTRKTTDLPPYLDPRHPAGWVDDKAFVNTYAPLVTVPTDEDPKPFYDLLKHVAPDDWEWLLDWIACKVQRPWERLTAVVSYTPTFGTGRNSLFDIVALLLGRPNCLSMTADRLFGQKASQFNSHLGSLLVTIGEADEGVDDDRRMTNKTFNRLKELVDPDQRWFTMERKGVDGVSIETFASFMIATNAGAGLPLEAGDRRFSVLEGNAVPLMARHPDIGNWLGAVRHDEGGRQAAILSAIHADLMQRDLSGFVTNQPHNTAAKDALIEASKPVVDVAIEMTLDILIGDMRPLEEQQRKPANGVDFREPLPMVAGPQLGKLVWELHGPDGSGELGGMKEDRVLSRVAYWLRGHAHTPKWMSSKMRVPGFEGTHRARILNRHRGHLMTQNRDSGQLAMAAFLSVTGGAVAIDPDKVGHTPAEHFALKARRLN